MTFADFLGIAIVGVGLKYVIDWVAAKYKLTSNGKKGLVVALAVVVGGVYTWLSKTPYLAAVVEVLAAASTAYALLKPSKK